MRDVDDVVVFVIDDSTETLHRVSQCRGSVGHVRLYVADNKLSNFSLTPKSET